MLTIIILNYNGWKDTIPCLASLKKQTMQDFHVVIADNGSKDDSLKRIEEWINLEKTSKQMCLLPLGENYGFAKGNNKAIEAVRNEKSDYYWCLNNDTIVEPDCLERLVNYMDQHPQITVLTPAIRLYNKPDYMWNAGGELVFGGRRYFCPMQPASLLNGKHVLDITFVTGCALLIRRSLVENEPLFTERFFFGEEDYHFSLRMKRERRKMVCLTSAVIYHKVSASQTAVVSYNKLFIHTLNRIIDLRTAYPKPKYIFWMMLYIPYLYWHFLRSMNFGDRNRFISLLLHEARTNDGVSKQLFEHYLHYPFAHAQ